MPSDTPEHSRGMLGYALRWEEFAAPRRPFVKAVRFVLVGIVSSAVYAAVVALCVTGLGIDPKLASIIGYCAALPFNFIAHRQYTFVARGVIWREVLRFILVHLTNIAVSVGAVALVVDQLGYNYAVGVAAVVLLVPLSTFLMMNLWVFQDQRQ